MKDILNLLIPAAAGILAILIPRLQFGKRTLLIKDLELYKLIDGDFPAKSKFKASLNKRLMDYASIGARRNVSDIIVGVILFAIGFYLTLVVVSLGSWWLLGLIVTLSFMLISIFGIVEGFKKVARDEKGRPLISSKN